MPRQSGRRNAREMPSLQGELQSQLMPVLWRLGEGTVEEVRAGLPSRYRSAYNTVQTVLNRLAERGLLERERRGASYVYRPRMTEAEYLSRSIESTLAGASSEARSFALANLIGRLGNDEVERLRALAREVDSKRRGGAR